MKHDMQLWILPVILSATIKNAHSSLFYPSYSAYGIFAAIAVPLDLPHRNVFISYNFEANYNLPETWGIPKFLTGIEDENLFADNARLDSGGKIKKGFLETVANTTKPRTSRSSTSLLSRTNFYRILLDKFQRSGFEGEPCLLRLICEVNSSELGDINGVLGSLIHIMFSTTTSRNENLPLKYYYAEMDGRHDQCRSYEESCSGSILDLISSPLYKY